MTRRPVSATARARSQGGASVTLGTSASAANISVIRERLAVEMAFVTRSANVSVTPVSPGIGVSSSVPETDSARKVFVAVIPVILALTVMRFARITEHAQQENVYVTQQRLFGVDSTVRDPDVLERRTALAMEYATGET